MYRKLLAAVILSLISTFATAQKTDTIYISAANINTKMLIPGTHRYLVYFKNGKDSARTMHQFWDRTIEFVQYNGADAIRVTQQWEDKDTIIHKVKSICDKKTFAPLYQESWRNKSETAVFDFVKKEALINGVPLKDLKDNISPKRLAAFEKALTQYTLNWHLDMEVFPTIHYKDNTTFMINFYDPGFPAPKYQAYTVIGSGLLTGYDNQKIDCWLVKHGSLPANQEIFWISKKNKEVLKLEQEFNGKLRYKIKLGFSS